MTHIENALYNSLSPRKRVEVDAHLAHVDEFPNECPYCGRRIPDYESFCSPECERLFLGVDRLMVDDRLRDEQSEFSKKEPDDDRLRDERMEMDYD